MEDQSSLLEALAALSAYFVGDAKMDETLTRVSQLSRSTISQSDQVGITLLVDNRPGTFVFTDPEIAEIDRAQYDTGDGPCLTAFRTGEVVRIPSTTQSERFPDFCRAAAASGFLSVLSLPLTTPQGEVGAMNHYSSTENAFTPAHVELGIRFAEQAAFLLVNAQAYWDARTLSENLRQAMESRATIEQAKGIIMANMGVDSDRAFEILKTQSQRENVKVREIAEELVRRSSTR